MDEESLLTSSKIMVNNSMTNPTVETSTVAAVASGTRKPMNAFFLFCKRHRALVKEIYPNLENRNITKILGEWWSTLNMDEKEPFNMLAVTYKEHLMKEKPNNIIVAQRKQISNHVLENIPDHQKSLIPQQQQPQPPTSGELNEKSHDASRGSSGSSSPEPSSGFTTSAPKPFKKRYLAAEKAKMGGVESSVETKNACEALLQLAEGGNIKLFRKEEKHHGDKSSNNGKVHSYDNIKEGPQFSVLRQAVWSRVAKTIMTQEEEKGKNANSNNGDTPINLSSQCLIPNSTIIEHIIENILNDNGDNNTSDVKSDNTANGTTATTGECSDEIKEKILKSLKDDMMRRTSSGIKDTSLDVSSKWTERPDPAAELKKKNGTNNTISALGLSNYPSANTALPKKHPKADDKAHSAPASQSGSGAPSPRGTESAVIAATTNNEMKTTTEPSVSVTLVTAHSNEDLPLNLSTTPPQTPAGASATVRNGNGGNVAVTITTASPAKRKLLEDDEDDIRRSTRACKGRRYQEFKDAVGKRGRRAGKSDSELSQHSEDEQQIPPQSSPSLASFSNPSVPSKPEDNFEIVRPHNVSNSLVTIANKPMTTTTSVTTHFDLEKALTAIPALRPEEFQKRIQVNRQQRTHAESSSTDHAMTSGSGNNAKRFKGAPRQRSASGNAMMS